MTSLTTDRIREHATRLGLTRVKALELAHHASALKQQSAAPAGVVVEARDLCVYDRFFGTGPTGAVGRDEVA